MFPFWIEPQMAALPQLLLLLVTVVVTLVQQVLVRH